MLSLNDIEKLNIFMFLRPYETKIRQVYERRGISAAKDYIYKFFHIKMTRAEVREFLDVKKNYLVHEAHRIAWSTCGWNGSISVIATHKHMDTSGTGKTAPKQQPKGPKEIEPNEEAYDEPQTMANQKTVELIAAGLLSPGNKLLII